MAPEQKDFVSSEISQSPKDQCCMFSVLPESGRSNHENRGKMRRNGEDQEEEGGDK